MEILKKFSDLLFDTALSVVGDYQRKAMDLAKIEAAACYVKGVQVVRRQCLTLLLIVFSLILLAVAIVVIPLTLIFMVPLSLELKIAAVCLMGVLTLGIAFAVLSHFLSSEKWMEFSKSNELVAHAIQKN